MGRMARERGGLTRIAYSAVVLVFGTACFCPAHLRAAPATDGTLSPNDPALVQLRIAAEELRRFDDKVHALWDGLTHEEQEKVRLTVATVPNPTKAMPSLLPLLREGKRAEAESLVKRIYGADDKMASLLTSLIGYANQIDTRPIEHERPPVLGKAGNSPPDKSKGTVSNVTHQ